MMEKERKAEILLKERRVRLIDVDTTSFLFEVKGDTERHFVQYDFVRDRWICDCLYYLYKQQECSHILASKLLLQTIKRHLCKEEKV